MSLSVFDHNVNPAIDPCTIRLSDKRGIALVKRKVAKFIKVGECTAVQALIPIARIFPKQRLRSHQGEVYKSAAIDTHPRFFQGGLNRTEHKPNAKPGILHWGHIGETKQTSKSNLPIFLERQSKES